VSDRAIHKRTEKGATREGIDLIRAYQRHQFVVCASVHSTAYGCGRRPSRWHGQWECAFLGRRLTHDLNAAFGLIFMWDGRAATLEPKTSVGPIPTARRFCE